VHLEPYEARTDEMGGTQSTRGENKSQTLLGKVIKRDQQRGKRVNCQNSREISEMFKVSYMRFRDQLL